MSMTNVTNAAELRQDASKTKIEGYNRIESNLELLIIPGFTVFPFN